MPNITPTVPWSRKTGRGGAEDLSEDRLHRKDHPSGFALKTHALLCRTYTKGRDWYDFIWYVDRGIRPEMGLLKNALFQQGPWAGEEIALTPSWLIDTLESGINSLDWAEVRRDVERFIPPADIRGTDNWSAGFFLDRLYRLARLMGEG